LLRVKMIRYSMQVVSAELHAKMRAMWLGEKSCLKEINRYI